MRLVATIRTERIQVKTSVTETSKQSLRISRRDLIAGHVCPNAICNDEVVNEVAIDDEEVVGKSC